MVRIGDEMWENGGHGRTGVSEKKTGGYDIW